jgi:hypothetical protein
MMDTDMNKESQTPAKKCPICGKPADKSYDPFCSKRCADVDLNRWLSGVYKIPTNEAPKDSESVSDQDSDSV